MLDFSENGSEHWYIFDFVKYSKLENGDLLALRQQFWKLLKLQIL